MRTIPELKAILQSNGIDSTSLQCLIGADQEAVYYLPIPGEEAIARWEMLRKLAPETGYWPVILGAEDPLHWNEMELDRYPQLPSPQALLAASRQVDAAGWFVEAAKKVDLERQIALELAMADVPDGEVVDIDVLEARVAELLSQRAFTLDDLLGIWPSDVQPRRKFDIPIGFVWAFSDRTPRSTVYCRFVPTTESWLVPIYLRWGGVNDCPTPSEQSSLLRRWAFQYGAEVVGIWPHDAIEFYVHRPPDNRKDALNLAYEHFVYCPDIINQGTGSIATLAALLLAGQAWTFWWD